MCDCIEQIEKRLKEEYNTTAEMDVIFTIGGEVYPAIRYHYRKASKNGKIQKKPTTKIIIPEYCPFCGKQYKEE